MKALVLVLGISVALDILLAACGGGMSAKDKADIAADGVRIAMCQARTHECKLTAGDAAARLCWPVYDECMVGAGLRDGGYHE